MKCGDLLGAGGETAKAEPSWGGLKTRPGRCRVFSCSFPAAGSDRSSMTTTYGQKWPDRTTKWSMAARDWIGIGLSGLKCAAACAA